MASIDSSWSAHLSPVSSKSEVWDEHGRLIGVMRRGVFFQTGRVGELQVVWNERGEPTGAIDDCGEFVHHDGNEVDRASH